MCHYIYELVVLISAGTYSPLDIIISNFHHHMSAVFSYTLFHWSSPYVLFNYCSRITYSPLFTFIIFCDYSISFDNIFHSFFYSFITLVACFMIYSMSQYGVVLHMVLCCVIICCIRAVLYVSPLELYYVLNNILHYNNVIYTILDCNVL